MPYYAYCKGLQCPLRFDTKAAFYRFVDSLPDVKGWWFSAETDIKEKLALLLAKRLRGEWNGEK